MKNIPSLYILEKKFLDNKYEKEKSYEEKKIFF